LKGSIILPPFCDAHIHSLRYGFSLQRVDCETPTRAECLQRIARRVQETKPGQWVLGHGWNHNVWPEGAGNRQMLDEISPNNPIYLTHKSLHSAWANSLALQLAGITDTSPIRKAANLSAIRTVI
jgi:predicted amidohydrolase YtcJ